MSTSCIGEQLDAIVAGLRARAGLAEVNVFSAPVAVGDAGLECIAFGECELSEVHGAFGGTREETWQIKGEIRKTAVAWEGDIEATIAADRDRVLEIFAEIETYLNGTYTGSLPYCQLTEASLVPYAGPEGRWTSLLFGLELKAHKNP